MNNVDSEKGERAKYRMRWTDPFREDVRRASKV